VPILFKKSIGNGIANTFVPKILPIIFSNTFTFLDTRSLKKLSVQTFSELTALWNKQNRSSLAADKLRESLGMLLPTPGDTRWNSVYDAVAKVNALLAVPEQETKLEELLDQLTLSVCKQCTKLLWQNMLQLCVQCAQLWMSCKEIKLWASGILCLC